MIEEASTRVRLAHSQKAYISHPIPPAAAAERVKWTKRRKEQRMARPIIDHINLGPSNQGWEIDQPKMYNKHLTNTRHVDLIGH